MKIAVSLEFPLGGGLALDLLAIGRFRVFASNDEAMSASGGGWWVARRKGSHRAAISMPPEGHDDGLFSIDKTVERGALGPVGKSETEVRAFHFAINAGTKHLG
jgi:hypothetical protein